MTGPGPSPAGRLNVAQNTPSYRFPKLLMPWLWEGQLEAAEGLRCCRHPSVSGPKVPKHRVTRRREAQGPHCHAALLLGLRAEYHLKLSELLRVGSTNCGQGLAQAELGLGLHGRVRRDQVPSLTGTGQ